MSAITQSPDHAVAPQQLEGKTQNPQIIATATEETNKSNNNLSQSEQDFANEQQNPQAEKQLDHEQLEKVAQQLQEFMGEMNRSLQFQVDEESGRDVIKVIDKSSGDVIKQYPSEEVLDLVAKLSETAGFLIDQTV